MKFAPSRGGRTSGTTTGVERPSQRSSTDWEERGQDRQPARSEDFASLHSRENAVHGLLSSANANGRSHRDRQGETSLARRPSVTPAGSRVTVEVRRRRRARTQHPSAKVPAPHVGQLVYLLSFTSQSRPRPPSRAPLPKAAGVAARRRAVRSLPGRLIACGILRTARARHARVGSYHNPGIAQRDVAMRDSPRSGLQRWLYRSILRV